jgi:hypothetical protein
MSWTTRKPLFLINPLMSFREGKASAMPLLRRRLSKKRPGS